MENGIWFFTISGVGSNEVFAWSKEMKKLSFLTVIILLFWGEFAFGQGEKVWMYGWRPAQTQQLYDEYMERLYVTKPYLQEDYERDAFNLYSRLQSYKKLSDYCQGKATDHDTKRILNVTLAYQLWKEKNKEYVEQVNSFWRKSTTSLENGKKLKLLERIELQNKESIQGIKYYHDLSMPCREIFDTFAYEDGKRKLIARALAGERFSDAYRNIHFFLHPEKKEEFIKTLKEQLNAGLAEEKACKKSGGKWQPVGARQSMACITTYLDAGKSCTDGSECQGGCVQVSGFRPGDPILGKCKENNNQFGGNHYLKNGKASLDVLFTD
jgi:hypothetical protein